MDSVPGYEGSIGPFPQDYSQPHVYARDIQSGAGNCVCGAALGEDIHTEAAPGVPVPDGARMVCKAAQQAEPQRFVLGLAYQAGPDPNIRKGKDGGRDFFTKAELEKAAWSFMRNGPRGGLFHVDGTEGHVEFVESGIHRGPDWDTGNGLVLKDGDWFVGAICDPIAWDLAVSGKAAGFSPQGLARRRKIRPAAA